MICDKKMAWKKYLAKFYQKLSVEQKEKSEHTF